MNNKYVVPSTYNYDEKLIWELLIYRDFIAFYNQNWDLIKNDFIEEGFFGIDGQRSSDKSSWCLYYDSLETYKIDWLRQSIEFNKNKFINNPLDVLFHTTILSKIEIKDTVALVHKEFNGVFTLLNKKTIYLNWLSLFVLRKTNKHWKIASFIGYLPK
ncbi:MAG: hypothetical protein V3U87_09970 [Methylococcaceae bacterium]